MSRFRLSSAAESDLQNAWRFVAQDSIESADRILDLIRTKIQLLAAHPEIGEIRPELSFANFRSAIAGNYVIFYRALDDTTIDIIRIVHGARDFHELDWAFFQACIETMSSYQRHSDATEPDLPRLGQNPSMQRTIDDVVCTGCGCACDDIQLSVAGGRILAAERACDLGKTWLLRQRGERRPPATIDGGPATLAEAVSAAAQMLAAARYPLIFGLSDTSCQAQPMAVSIGDWLGACVDSRTSIERGPSAVTFSGVGEVTSSLGEVRHRGDLVIFWGANPAVSHPRHAERYSLDPVGMFVPAGRAGRTCVVVDVQESESARRADLFLPIKPGADFEALWALRALVKGLPLDAVSVAHDTGVPLATWQDLTERMKRAHFGVICHGAGLTHTRGGYVNAEAVLALTRDMNAFTRFVCLPLRGPGNVAGADNVLLWMTGYPFAVNFSRGYPRYGPGEFTAAEVLDRREADAALVLSGDPACQLPAPAREHLESIPSVYVGADDGVTAGMCRVVIRTATYGIHTAGTVYRMDDVPLPLRAAIDSPYPSDVTVLAQIEAQVKRLRGYGPIPPARERSRRA